MVEQVAVGSHLVSDLLHLYISMNKQQMMFWKLYSLSSLCFIDGKWPLPEFLQLRVNIQQ